MKRLLSITTLLLLAVASFAYDNFVVDGLCYREITDNTCGVDYPSNGVQYSGDIIIPSKVTHNGKTYTVTSIGLPSGEGAFAHSNITSITIPSSVTTIGNDAFYGCSDLTSITIPESVTSIGGSAFYNTAWYNNQPDGLVYAGKVAYKYKGTMPSNTSIVLEEGTFGIAGSAFWGCSGLTSITIPSSVTNIGSWAFYGCTGLTSIALPNSVTSIGSSAFSGTAWYNNQSGGLIYAGKIVYKYKGTMPENTSILIKEGTVSIGNDAFYGCSGLTSITIPSSVTNIGSSAFSGCSGLTSITIPSSVTNIGSLAFYGCTGLTSITIPESVTSIGSSAFSDCSGLTSITIPSGVTSIGSSAFSGCSGLTSITIPSGVTSIGSSAFSGCSGLTSITIPSSVTSIDSGTFWGCSSLTSMKVDVGNSKYDSRDNCNAIIETSTNTLITGCKTTIIPSSVTNIGSSAFSGCSGLTSITIPSSVTSVGDWAFSSCTGLTSITIPSSVTSIGDYAFRNCSGLTSITIPSNVTSIGDYAFDGCSNLTSVTLNSNAIASKTYTSSSCIKNIFGAQVKTYTLGGDITSIGSYAFYGCSAMETLKLSNNLNKIEPYAFYGCSGLGRIDIPSGVTTIEDNAFYNCSNVVYARIPSSVTNIGTNALPANNIVKKVGSKNYITLTEFNIDPGSFAQLWVYNNHYAFSVLYPFVKSYSATPTSIEYHFQKPLDNVKITSFEANGKQIDLETYTLKDNGLNPNTEHQMEFKIVANGSTFNFKEIYRDYVSSQNYHAMYRTFKTGELTLTTEQPKVVSMGNVIVSATTNVDPEEKNVGFEWRRTDWTSDFASNSGNAVIYDNTMEGYIRNLNTDKLWKYRAYYLSDNGTYYYGDWVGLDASNTSYFEPTVHTYADISTTGNVALIRGYVLNGTDKIKVQGFKYWKTANKGNSLDIDMEDDMQTTAIPADAIIKTVDIVGSGQQLMNATLEGLDYDATYHCVAFATTTENETFYGEEQMFTTESITGIEGVKESAAGSSKAVTVVAYYDLNGKRLTLPQKGLNIIRMSDGTTRKVVK